MGFSCTQCLLVKPTSEYYSNIRGGRRRACRDCLNLRRRTKVIATPGFHRTKGLKQNYGIDQEAYELMLYMQDGKCRICKTSNPGVHNFFNVDHDHVSDRIRGLLCHSCNLALGHFKDSISNLNSAVEYLVVNQTAV